MFVKVCGITREDDARVAVAALQADATGTVTDFKVTDGKGIGVVVKLASGATTWFFDDEITAA